MQEKKYPAIIVTHPGGVKEQCPYLYVWNLIHNGYTALAFDTSHQSERKEYRVIQKHNLPH